MNWIVFLIIVIASLIWFGISALLVFLASLAFGFTMSLAKVLFVFVVGLVIKAILPGKE